MRVILFLGFILTLCTLSYGAERCTYNHDEIKVNDTYSLKELLAISADLSKELCLIKVGEKSDKSKLKSLSEIWKISAYAQLGKVKEAGIDLDEGIKMLATAFAKATPGSFVVNAIPRKSWQVKTPGDNGRPQITRGIIPDTPERQCRNAATGKLTPCIDILEDFRIAVHAANADKNRLDMENTLNALGLYSSSWDQYFEKARSLTPWELGLNTLLYKDELQSNTFVLPPRYQWFFVHPSIVIENVSDALDGEQQKEAIALEWFGINQWNAKTPIGLSIVSTYADRAGIDDVRHGLMIHINNNYSVGFTGIGTDEEGFFVTIDLLKMTQGKKQRFKNYTSKIKR